jgi:hypothetical protein
MNPEATASLLSFALYSFMDPVIWAAQRMKQVTVSDLPNLLEADKTAFLAASVGQDLHGISSGQPFVRLSTSLSRMFRGTFGLQALIMALNVGTLCYGPV